jgi:hypothetical protein
MQKFAAGKFHWRPLVSGETHDLSIVVLDGIAADDSISMNCERTQREDNAPWPQTIIDAAITA